MTTKLDGILKRELSIGGEPYTLTLSQQGFTLTLKGRRKVYIAERDAFAQVPVYDGHRMRCGQRIAGPALVEQQTTAIVISEGYDCQVDALGSFVLYAKGREDLVECAAHALETTA